MVPVLRTVLSRMRPNSMRNIWLTIGLMLLPLGAAATPADTLAEARQQISEGHMYSADALLQEVVHDDDTSVAELQEALFLQCMVYSGDVLGAVALIGPMSAASPEGSEFKGEISRQLVLARRAFTVAMNSYLNGTVLGGELAQVKLALPKLASEDVDVLMSTLRDPATLAKINNTYSEDPAPGRGLLSQINLYSYYLAFSDAVPGAGSRDLAAISQAFKVGQQFDDLHFLDWAARVALDMHALLNEPNGPDLQGLARRCDQRIIEQAGEEADNVYVKNARVRAGK